MNDIAADFDWDDLRPFLAVARSGRLTEAARRLRQDHTTVSRRLAALEAALGAKLFERRPQGYRLTPAGERLLATAEKIESAALQAKGQLGALSGEIAGVVRIGTPDGFGSFFLAPRIGALADAHPGLDIELVAMPRLFSLSKREADIAIGLRRPAEGRILARKLTDYRLGLYASAAYLDAHPAIRAPGDLIAHRLIGYIDDFIFTPELDYVSLFQPAARARLRSSSLVAQMRATQGGAGICVLPHFMAAQESNLRPILSDSLSLTRTFWLLSHEDSRDSPAIRATADFITATVRAAKAVFG